MKRNGAVAAIPIAAVVVALATGCGGLASFDVDLPADGFIPAAANVTGQFAAYEDAGATISQTFANKGVKSGDFKSAKLTQGSLSVPVMDAMYMAKVQSFAIEVSAPGLATAEVAHLAQASSAAQVPLVMDGVELKPYLTAASVTFTAKPAFALPPPPFNIPLHVDLTLRVQVL